MENTLFWFAFASALVAYVTYGLSIVVTFRDYPDHDERNQLVLKILSVLTWLACLWALWSHRPELSETKLGIVLGVELLCIVVYWIHSNIARSSQFSCAYSRDLPRKLEQRGLYKWIRHPFYTTYLTSYFVVAAVTLDPYAIGFSLAILVVYYRAARFEEAKFARSDLAADYEAYKRRAFMFFPRFF